MVAACVPVLFSFLDRPNGAVMVDVYRPPKGWTATSGTLEPDRTLAGYLARGQGVRGHCQTNDSSWARSRRRREISGSQGRAALQIMRRPRCRAHPVLPRPMTLDALDKMIDLSVPRPDGMREICGAARRLLAA